MSNLTRIFRLSDWERHRIKIWLIAAGRFGGTVLCTALATLWIERQYPHWKRSWLAHTGARKLLSYQPSRPPVSPQSLGARPKNLGDHYGRYLEEALPLLRQDTSVRMVKMEMPGSILEYQQSQALRGEGQMIRMGAATSRVPVLAVSKNAKEFLTTMRITFVDPNDIPSDRFKGAKPLAEKTLRDGFLLIPDVTGSGARNYNFARK
jgi:hypothetical protein